MSFVFLLWVYCLANDASCCSFIERTYTPQFSFVLCYQNSVKWCSVFIDAKGGCWSLKPAAVSSALHSICLKGKGIKEQMHNWIYTTHLDKIFIFLISHEKCSCFAEFSLLRSLCLCVCERESERESKRLYASASLVGAWYDFTRYACQYRSLTPGRPADLQIDNIILYRPLSIHWLRWSSMEVWFLKPAEFARHWPYASRSNLQHGLFLIWSEIKYTFKKQSVLSHCRFKNRLRLSSDVIML